MKVAILGASPKPERYSHKAQRLLEDFGHETFPISLAGEDILGRTGYRSIQEIPEEERPIHTVTVYLAPERFAEVIDDVIQFHPGRVILNPGTESPESTELLRDAGIHVVEACTLVILGTGEFETI